MTPTRHARAKALLLAVEGPAAAGALPVGVFGPQCQDHEAIEIRPRVFRTRIDDGTGTYWSFHDTLVNWPNGVAPYELFVNYAGPGKLGSCP